MEHAFHLVSVLVITLVFSHLVNEEQRQALDAAFEQLAFFLEMRFDGLPNLHTLHVQFVGVADNLATAYGCAI